ncbi:hypothetical protein OH77DRAFT_712870 [Trametes cingulata]|nr:hypothetical protein OH77DRAFT_712870 [Trametes cingulata]
MTLRATEDTFCSVRISPGILPNLLMLKRFAVAVCVAELETDGLDVFTKYDAHGEARYEVTTRAAQAFSSRTPNALWIALRPIAGVQSMWLGVIIAGVFPSQAEAVHCWQEGRLQASTLQSFKFDSSHVAETGRCMLPSHALHVRVTVNCSPRAQRASHPLQLWGAM